MKYDRDFFVSVVVTVNDPDVIDRVVNNDDNWQGTYYRMTTASDVIDHLAYNCAANGVERANRLDGWADLPDDAATMRMDRVDLT